MIKDIIKLLSRSSIWITGLLLFGCGERLDESDKALLRFMNNNTAQSELAICSNADSFFNNSVPIYPDSKLTLFYVVDGSCSICMAQALHCFQHFMKIRREKEVFCFILLECHQDLFTFYCEKAGLANDAVINTVDSIGGLDQGLYLVRDIKVTNYREWNWI